MKPGTFTDEDYERIRDTGIFPNMRGKEGEELVNAFWENSWESLTAIFKKANEVRNEPKKTETDEDDPF